MHLYIFEIIDFRLITPIMSHAFILIQYTNKQCDIHVINESLAVEFLVLFNVMTKGQQSTGSLCN